LARFAQVPELPLGVGERQRVSGGFEKGAVTGSAAAPTSFGIQAKLRVKQSAIPVVIRLQMKTAGVPQDSREAISKDHESFLFM
jgi:hypothetical protein